MTVRARPFCSDVHIERLDEAWKAFIMISLALVYSVTLLGPWATVKSWANISEVGDWQGFSLYALIVWLGALAVIPAIWALSAWVGRALGREPSISVKTLFLRYSYLLVPLGLCAWVAFSFPLILVNFTHILATASDPMGWGWDLLGTAGISWSPLWPEYMVYIQIPILLLGLLFALKRGYGLAGELYRDRWKALGSLIPVSFSCVVILLVFLALFAG